MIFDADSAGQPPSRWLDTVLTMTKSEADAIIAQIELDRSTKTLEQRRLELLPWAKQIAWEKAWLEIGYKAAYNLYDYQRAWRRAWRAAWGSIGFFACGRESEPRSWERYFRWRARMHGVDTVSADGAS